MSSGSEPESEPESEQESGEVVGGDANADKGSRLIKFKRSSKEIGAAEPPPPPPPMNSGYTSARVSLFAADVPANPPRSPVRSIKFTGSFPTKAYISVPPSAKP